GRTPGGVRVGLALGQELPGRARAGGAVALRRGAECDLRPGPGAYRAACGTGRLALDGARPRRGGGARLAVLAAAPRDRRAAGGRARADPARLLERTLAERDRDPARAPARHREDAHPCGARPARRRPRGGAGMKGPDFRELVGEEGTPEELERLRRVHDLLVSAGPPPEDVPAAPAPPKARIIPFRPRVATVTPLAAAAAIAVAFGIGFLVGNSGGGFPTRFSVSMHGVGTASAASALVRVGSKDAHGNWPLLFSVRNLPSLGKQGYYELYLWH